MLKNKRRPQEVTSKRPVTRRRTVVEVKTLVRGTAIELIVI